MNHKFIYLVLFIFLFSSCYRKNKSIVITDFSNSIIDTITPNKRGSYTTAIFEIEGYSNDTIKVQFYGYKRKLIGDFKRSIKMDYYGGLGEGIVFKFAPYKANKGELKIRYGIN